MGRRVHACWPDDSPEAASTIMRAHGVRRLPVVDAEGILQGVITLHDLAGAFSARSVSLAYFSATSAASAP